MSVSSGQSLQLADYLEKLPGTTFRKLYLQPSTAFAIFRRMIPPLAKTIVMAILYMPKPMLLEDLDVWVKPESRRQKDQAISTLRSLHILQITVPSKERPQEMQLTTNFKSSLRLALEGGGTHNSFGVPSSLPVPPEITVPFLDRYARRKWEDILHYIVNTVNPGGADLGGPKSSVKNLLVAGQLVRRQGSAVGITQAGFTFLLQEANAQVWTLLLLWLEATDHAEDAAGMESTDMLSFLFLLASLELGRAYDTNALTEARRNMLPSLLDFGLIYIPSHKPQQYFPTRLATTLTSSSSALRSAGAGFSAALAAATGPRPSPSNGLTPGGSEEGKGGGSIIVETNYRVYAYGQTPLQIAVLSLFCKLKLRFADMVSGRLTRNSIRNAVERGITADQIISYLAAHAHEQMHRMAAVRSRPVLPPTVVDQIRLWQLETERMTTTSGFLFRDFDSPKEYEVIAGYASEIGVLVWRNDKLGMFFASKHEQIRDYLKLRKKAED
ncbi:transcription factor tfb2 [Colletotrichum higginsianum IMI 349063]|uniref:RNA polymerase II transcription factor B subunit 2 n=3 Tax=Colletotrichum higginsianum TaxID=80884 RepID=A0A1B7YGR8_COLHI|nr:transcription factor tfb2 [Colletotrichum higginsianum IMI 349063]OBR11008.1 transcription factor tfb2 [Colletotrichum higginsianum IMI 349063]TID06309.1 RNA polymerase II transcription factor B subunit 2 [Colletotrichum higginsianum]